MLPMPHPLELLVDWGMARLPPSVLPLEELLAALAVEPELPVLPVLLELVPLLAAVLVPEVVLPPVPVVTLALVVPLEV